MTQITEKFYPLTENYTEKLREGNLTAAEWRIWSYLISFDPWGDKYQELPDTLTILSKCKIKKSTFYTAIAKFQELGLFDFQDNGFKFRNLAGIAKIQNFQNLGKNSKELETIPKNWKTVQEIGKNSKELENELPKPASDKDSNSPQTIQIIQIPQTIQKGVEDQEILIKESEPYKKSEDQVKGHLPRAVLPFDLINRLETLGIQIDQQLKTAIAAYHISQAYGAVRHVENTYETISNPRSVFLYQMPKQKIEHGPKPLSPEFLEWYQTAIADGLVIDYPPEHLPKDFTGEPKVKLTIDKYWLENWEKVRDRPQDYREVVKIPLIKFESIPKTPVTQNTTELLRDPIIGPGLQSKLSKTHSLTLDENGIAYEINEEYEQ